MGMESIRWKGPAVGTAVGLVLGGIGVHYIESSLTPTTFGSNHALAKGVGCNQAGIEAKAADKAKTFIITLGMISSQGGDTPYAVAGLDASGNIIGGPQPIDSKNGVFDEKSGIGTASFEMPDQPKFLFFGTNSINPVVLAHNGNGDTTIARCPSVPLAGDPKTVASIPQNPPAASPTPTK